MKRNNGVPDGCLALEEAARMTGRAPSTLLRKMREGKLRFVQPFGGGKKFPLEEDIRRQLLINNHDYVQGAIALRDRETQAKNTLRRFGIKI